ncbi:MAG: hypothetical protein U0T77_10725 [Chitinophagales bacterium]
MKKTYSLEELNKIGQEKAAKLGVSKLIATTDGQFFIPSNISYAKMHIKQNRGLEMHELEYAEVNHTITNEDLENNPDLAGEVKAGDVVQIPVTKKSAAERIAEIKTLETLADVEKYIKSEKSFSVLKAAAERQKEIMDATAESDKKNNRN